MNVFVQQGYKVVGSVVGVEPQDTGYHDSLTKLTAFVGTTFRTMSIIEITPVSFDEIIAPGCRMFPDSRPDDRIRETLATYRVDEYQKCVE